MKRRYAPNEIPTRAEAWKGAAFTALVAAAIALLTIKLFTGIAFAPAAGVALFAFLVFFAMALRTTPHRG